MLDNFRQNLKEEDWVKFCKALGINFLAEEKGGAPAFIQWADLEVLQVDLTKEVVEVVSP